MKNLKKGFNDDEIEILQFSLTIKHQRNETKKTNFIIDINICAIK